MDNIKKFFEDMSENYIIGLQKAFPHIDVKMELSKAKIYLLANKDRNYTNLEAFIFKWMNNAKPDMLQETREDKKDNKLYDNNLPLDVQETKAGDVIKFWRDDDDIKKVYVVSRGIVKYYDKGINKTIFMTLSYFFPKARSKYPYYAIEYKKKEEFKEAELSVACKIIEDIKDNIDLPKQEKFIKAEKISDKINETFKDTIDDDIPF